jgi:SulP family sulfate permease
MHSFEPKLISCLREGIPARQVLADLIAGITVGIVALPLAIAFAIASGVKPEQGLYTAIFAGFAISVLGGSRVQIGGPTGAFVVIVYGIVEKHGYDGLAIATLMAGAMLIAFGLARMGRVIAFIPYPVTLGFTAGIALIIATSQVGELLGLRGGALPSDFVAKLRAYAGRIDTIEPAALAIGLGTIVLVALWPRLTRRVPGSLVAILASAVLVEVLGLPVETIGDRFGAVPSAFPEFRPPALSLEACRELLSPAVAIALLAGIESLLSAVVADGMTGRRHRPNAELVAQGVANVVSPLFGGIPATGAIARTATNVKSGGRTPLAGIVHALTVLAILLFFGSQAAKVPLAALAGILIVVAYNMSEWRLVVKQLRSPPGDVVVLLATLGLTVLFDLIIAIQVGVVLAALLFMRRMAELSGAGLVDVDAPDDGDDDPNRLRRRDVPEGIEVFEINGPFFFAAAEKFTTALARVDRSPRVLILRMRRVPAMDATALHALEEAVSGMRRRGTQVLLSGLEPQPRAVLERAGFLAALGEANVLPGIDAALARACALVAAAGTPP